MTVLTEGESRYRELAEEIADDRGERAVSDFQFVTDGPLLYVAAPGEIRETTVVELADRLQEKGPDRGAFGIITGHTVESARSFYYRGQSSREYHCVFSNFQDVDWESADDDLTILSEERATVEELERLNEDGLASLSLLSEGHSIHLQTDDGFVCGFPTVDKGHEFEGRQPFCVDGTARNCPYDGRLLPADELDATHAFVDSCVSVLPGNDFEGLPVHVGLGLLENVTTMIGTFRPGVAVAQECLLHQALLREGYSTAERCFVLNENGAALGMGDIPYLVFGTPETRLQTATAGEYEVALDLDADPVRMAVSDVRANIIDVRVPGEAFPEDGDRFFVRNLDDSRPETPLFFSAFRDGNDVRVLIYSYQTIVRDDLAFEVGTDPAGYDDQRRIERQVSNLRKLRRFDLSSDQVEKHLSELTNHLSTLPSTVEEETYDADAYRTKRDRVSQLDSILEKARDKLIAFLEDRYLPLIQSDYESNVVQREVGRTVFDCPYCTRTTFARADQSIDGRHYRTQCVCPMCGFTFDVPGEIEDAVPYPQIRGELTNVPPEETEFEVRFENGSETVSEVTFFAWIASEYDEFRGSDPVTPRTRVVEIPPGETESVTFTADLTEFTPNEYLLTVYALADLDVYHSIRKVVVGEKMGHVLGTRL